jgi:hypothetical protein
MNFHLSLEGKRKKGAKWQVKLEMRRPNLGDISAGEEKTNF